METFPISITELLELRYLSLSYTNIKELPKKLGKLVKLNYLDLSYMDELMTIPSGVIGSLVELRVLNLYYCYAVWDFDQVYKLKHLNDLGININTHHNLNKLLSNQSLQMCTRRLHLFSSPSSSTTTTLGLGNTKSLEKLELLSNLEELCLDSLPELMNVNMAQEAPFQNLGQISIRQCNSLKDLTWVGYVVNLKDLRVLYCEEIVIVVVDDLGGSTGGGGDEISMVMNNVEDVFKRLDSLYIRNLPKLKSICRNALDFPCLESILVLKCPQLKKLPFDSSSNVNNTLRNIFGEEEWWNELRWEEEEDNNNNNNKNNNNNNELLKSKFLPYFVKIESFNKHDYEITWK